METISNDVHYHFESVTMCNMVPFSMRTASNFYVASSAVNYFFHGVTGHMVFRVWICFLFGFYIPFHLHLTAKIPLPDF